MVPDAQKQVLHPGKWVLRQVLDARMGTRLPRKGKINKEVKKKRNIPGSSLVGVVVVVFGGR